VLNFWANFYVQGVGMLDLQTQAQIIESFAATTGVPAFLMDGNGNILLASRGYSLEEYAFADLETLQHFFDSNKKLAASYENQAYTVFTDNQFLYNFVPLSTDPGNQKIVCGPVRFHPPTDLQLTTLLKSHQISLRNKAEIAQKLARLPNVSSFRLVHLGRVLWSLCHAYNIKVTQVMPDTDLLAAAQAGHLANEPRITFTMTEEENHAPLDVMQLAKHIILQGDVAGARALRDQKLDLHTDQLFEQDALLSVKYRLITACGIWTGLIFDQHVPYEQVVMTLNQYTRQASESNSIPQLTNLLFESVEAFAWIVRKYSTQHYTRPVRQVVQYVQTNMTRKITLEDLAKLTRLSPSYLSRLIKQETGASLIDLIDSYRIEESKFLLTNTRYSVLRIAEMVGFTYQNHFSLHFKKYTGMTPTFFRQNGETRPD